MGLIVYVDGGSRGNPGPAGGGVVISADDGTLIHEGAYYFGRQTNNAAEYYALIHALQRAARCGQDTVTIYSDSELLVRQLTGRYRVKSKRLAQLFGQVQLLLLKVPCWNVQHVPRERNRRADELANLAMNGQRDVILFDADPSVAGGSASLAGASAGNGSEIGTAAGLADPGSQPEAAGDEGPQTPVPEAGTAHAVRVTLARAPQPGGCPAGECPCESFTVESSLPADLCIHAAHALLPTVIAVLNTEPAEFAAVPTLTVRCMRPECGATFHVSPVRSSNGAAKRQRPS